MNICARLGALDVASSIGLCHQLRPSEFESIEESGAAGAYRS